MTQLNTAEGYPEPQSSGACNLWAPWGLGLGVKPRPL